MKETLLSTQLSYNRNDGSRSSKSSRKQPHSTASENSQQEKRRRISSKGATTPEATVKCIETAPLSQVRFRDELSQTSGIEEKGYVTHNKSNEMPRSSLKYSQSSTITLDFLQGPPTRERSDPSAKS